jgi:hypothetical protein
VDGAAIRFGDQSSGGMPFDMTYLQGSAAHLRPSRFLEFQGRILAWFGCLSPEFPTGVCRFHRALVIDPCEHSG